MKEWRFLRPLLSHRCVSICHSVCVWLCACVYTSLWLCMYMYVYYVKVCRCVVCLSVYLCQGVRVLMSTYVCVSNSSWRCVPCMCVCVCTSMTSSLSKAQHEWMVKPGDSGTVMVPRGTSPRTVMMVSEEENKCRSKV